MLAYLASPYLTLPHFTLPCLTLLFGQVLAYREDANGDEIKLRIINDASDFTYFGEVRLSRLNHIRRAVLHNAAP